MQRAFAALHVCKNGSTARCVCGIIKRGVLRTEAKDFRNDEKITKEKEVCEAKERKIFVRYKKQFSADDSWTSISMQAGHDATLQNAKEFADMRRSRPQMIEVDETGKTPKVNGYRTYDDKKYERDPWRMYQYKPSASEPQGDPSKRAQGRAVYVREILPGGETRIVEKEEFKKTDSRAADGKKNKNGSSYFDQLYQITRTGAQGQQEYDTSLYRTEMATKAFENNKYLIEQKAALAQVPPAMLGAAMFHFYGDTSNNAEKYQLTDKEIDELFRGSDLGKTGMNADALREYTKTREGAAEVAAYILRVEARKRGYDLSNLKGTQGQEILAAFNRRMKISDTKGAITKQLVPVFENIYASLPGQEREVNWLEDSDNYYDYADVFGR